MTFRFARHTNNLEPLKSFYCTILGLEILGGFENHDGYDGVFIGKADENWHLEFTKSTEIIEFNFGEEDILVFYPNSKLEYEVLLENLKIHSVELIKAKNPYWNGNGILFLDPDGYRIAISHLKIQ
ncbi:VOC family protein [Flavobacterium sp.]|uniref:VOC family protein n=1 Tax=Flavobacterium sp. TaxID=239 RepID=UPI002B4B10F3|nr:VOC family protein [Flavobacterium sp.]HLP65184.1 VOC family protein [Flavobacterium sp.]